MTLVFVALMVFVLVVVVPHYPLWAALLIGAGQGTVCAFGIHGWWTWRRARRQRQALERRPLQGGWCGGGE